MISVKGVLGGILISQIMGVIFAVALMIASNLMPIHLDPKNILAYTKPSVGFQILAYSFGLFSVFIGGYVAALIAKRDEILNAILASILSLASLINSWRIGITPLWLVLVSLVAYVTFSGLGGYMRLKHISKKA